LHPIRFNRKGYRIRLIKGTRPTGTAAARKSIVISSPSLSDSAARKARYPTRFLPVAVPAQIPIRALQACETPPPSRDGLLAIGSARCCEMVHICYRNTLAHRICERHSV